MLDIQKIYRDTYSELKKMGIPVNEAEVVLRPFTEVTGKCRTNLDGTFTISIMKKLAVNDKYDCVRCTMAHELLHTCKDTCNHDAKWREYAGIAEENGHYGLFEMYTYNDVHGTDYPPIKRVICENCSLAGNLVVPCDDQPVKCPWCRREMKSVPVDSK